MNELVFTFSVIFYTYLPHMQSDTCTAEVVAPDLSHAWSKMNKLVAENQKSKIWPEIKKYFPVNTSEKKPKR